MIVDAVDGLDVSSTASLLSFYHSLDKVLRIAVTQRVGDFDIAFAAGLFAKTDFLSKQMELDKNIRRRINETSAGGRGKPENGLATRHEGCGGVHKRSV